MHSEYNILSDMLYQNSILFVEPGVYSLANYIYGTNIMTSVGIIKLLSVIIL